MRTFPENRTGKWAVGLAAVCLLSSVIFFILMSVGLVDFDARHWWDVVLAVVIPIELLSFALSIIAIRKEKTILTYCSLILGIIAFLFLLTHSLYIKD